MRPASILSLRAAPHLVEPCARMWHRQWGEALGMGMDAAVAIIQEVLAPQTRQDALVALKNDNLIGCVFLVSSELDLPQYAHLGPWLAGLYVEPADRHTGVGTALVYALVTSAAELGVETVYLYSVIPEFYRASGWQTCEQFWVHQSLHDLMSKPIDAENTQAPP